MISLKDFMQTIDYKVTDSDEYLWECYGPNARHMTADNAEGFLADTVCCVFDTVDQTVYDMQAWDHDNNREYRWIHPDYIKAHKRECKARKVKHKYSFDGRKFIDLDVEDDILEKARAIFFKEYYDTRVIVPLTLNDDETHMLMKLAHEADMTCNDYIATILQNEIERMKK